MNDPAQAQMAKRRWLVFALACAMSWLLYVHRYALGVIKPALKAEYPDLSDIDLGWLDTLFYVTYAIGQVPGGMAGDAFGPRLVLTVLLATWSGSLAGIAWAKSLLPMAIARSGFGLTQAGVYPNLSKVTHSWFPLSIRTTVQGLVGTLAGRAGGACAPLIVATLLMGTLSFDWRTSLAILAASGLLLAGAFGWLFRDHPALPETTTPTTSPAPAPRPRIEWSERNIVTFAALLLYAASSTFADQLFVFWIPQFLTEGKGLSAIEMGVFAGLPLWGGALGGFAGGALNDWLIRRTGSVRLGRTVVGLAGKALLAALLVVSIRVADGRWVMVVLLIGKFFGDWALATQWGAITDLAGSAAGTVFAIVNTCGSVAGFLAGPIMGYLIQDHGWDALFLTVAGVNAIAALCWLFIDTSRRLSGDK
jgi:sugar phosphate permease